MVPDYFAKMLTSALTMSTGFEVDFPKFPLKPEKEKLKKMNRRVPGKNSTSLSLFKNKHRVDKKGTDVSPLLWRHFVKKVLTVFSFCE